MLNQHTSPKRGGNIEGCILPVDFVDFENRPFGGIGPVELLKKGEMKIEARPVLFMKRIRNRRGRCILQRIGGSDANLRYLLLHPDRHRSLREVPNLPARTDRASPTAAAGGGRRHSRGQSGRGCW